jgi:hypothetical protein
VKKIFDVNVGLNSLDIIPLSKYPPVGMLFDKIPSVKIPCNAFLVT